MPRERKLMGTNSVERYGSETGPLRHYCRSEEAVINNQGIDLTVRGLAKRRVTYAGLLAISVRFILWHMQKSSRVFDFTKRSICYGRF
jgi:hypothetical protein